MNDFPTWLATNGACPLPAAKHRWRRADYLTKTLADIQKIMAEDMVQAGVAARQGLLQAYEPRVKVAATVLLLLAVALTTSLHALAAFHGLLLLTALASGISLRSYLLRTWTPALIFAGVAVLPAIFSWVTPGSPLFVIYSGAEWRVGPLALPSELTVTRQGLTSAAMVMLRAAASLGLIVLLVKTTRWPALTKALHYLGMPAVFAMVLELTYRYLFLFLLLLADYLLGRRSRLVGGEAPLSGLRWTGGTLAGFLRLAGEYGQEIAAAMQARGFSGEIQTVPPQRPGKRDAALFVIVIIIGLGIVGGAKLGRF